MKLYLVYESNYGEIILEGCDSTDIVGIFKTREQAEMKRQELIEKATLNDGWVLDEQVKQDYLNKDVVIMFWQEQENWSNYYEIHIKEMEVN